MLELGVRVVAIMSQLQGGELHEMGNIEQPRVRDHVTVTQVQGGEPGELGNVL